MKKMWETLKTQWTHMSKRSKNWLLWGVVPTLGTLILLVFGDMWVGYSPLQAISNHFLDFCLTMFTLSVSIFSAATDLNRKLEKDDRVMTIGASAGLSVLCIVIFCFFYYRDLLIERGFEDLTPPSILCIAQFLFVVFAFLIIHTGIVLENKTT